MLNAYEKLFKKNNLTFIYVKMNDLQYRLYRQKEPTSVVTTVFRTFNSNFNLGLTIVRNEWVNLKSKK